MTRSCFPCARACFLLVLAFLMQSSRVECKLLQQGQSVNQRQPLTSDEEFDLLADQYYVDQDLEKQKEGEMSNEAKQNLKFYLAVMAASTPGVPAVPGSESNETETTTTATTTRRIRLPPTLQKRKESYDEGIQRLSCDDPWFWNSFECVWLDVRNQNILRRTEHNMRVAAIFGGILFALVAIPLCSCIIIGICIRRRIRKMEQRSNLIVDKLRPGVFVDPDGTRHYYDPTPEEEEAFVNLLIQFASVV